jgi:glutaredoxin-related protein
VKEYSYPILSKGRYQVVALTSNEEYDPDDVDAYAVVTTSGARIRQVLTLDDARSWMEQLAEAEGIGQPALQQPKPRPRRPRR